VQSLPTEAKPLAACSQCGTALPAPTGSATFVYGVGPVGYQSCNTCGAKWRYLWQDPPGAGGGLNRLPFLLVGTAIVVLVALGAVALLRSPTPYAAKSASAGTTTPSTSAAPSTTTTSPVPSAGRADFVRAITPVVVARAPFVSYLTNDASSSSQVDVNAHVDEFVKGAQSSVDQLKALRWPAAVAADVDQLVRANEQLISDVDLVKFGLQYSTSFTDKVKADVTNIETYEGRVNTALGG
jgi:hypothetical protein